MCILDKEVFFNKKISNTYNKLSFLQGDRLERYCHLHLVNITSFKLPQILLYKTHLFLETVQRPVCHMIIISDQ